MASSFDKNVFINCPLDKAYVPLLRTLLFTVLYVGLRPRLAPEQADSSETRVSKIMRLIRQSRFGIHDLSRCKATKKGEIFRLNMPFELGLDIGCKAFRGGKWKRKKCLILETKKYRYKAAISDLSNSDILAHRNDPREVVNQTRHWLNQEVPRLTAAAPSVIWGKFLDFMAEDYDDLTVKGWSKKDIECMAVPELLQRMRLWMKRNKDN